MTWSQDNSGKQKCTAIICFYSERVFRSRRDWLSICHPLKSSGCLLPSLPPSRLRQASPVYISSLALTRLVKIAIIFHPLIAHSIQQIGEHWLAPDAVRCGGRVAVEIGDSDNPPCVLHKWWKPRATYWLMIGTLDSDWQGCHDNATTTPRRPIEKGNKMFQCYTQQRI